MVNKITSEIPPSIIASPPMWLWDSVGIVAGSSGYAALGFDSAFAAGVKNLVLAPGLEDFNPLPGINLSLFTSLEYIFASYIDWAQSTITLPASVETVSFEGLKGVTEIDASACSGLDELSYMANSGEDTVTTVRIPATVVTSILAGGEQGAAASITAVVPKATLDCPSVTFAYGAITEASVNAILVALAAGTTNGGVCDLSGGTNAAPSGAGATAKITLTTTRGWTVVTN